MCAVDRHRVNGNLRYTSAPDSHASISGFDIRVAHQPSYSSTVVISYLHLLCLLCFAFIMVGTVSFDDFLSRLSSAAESGPQQRRVAAAIATADTEDPRPLFTDVPPTKDEWDDALLMQLNHTVHSVYDSPLDWEAIDRVMRRHIFVNMRPHLRECSTLKYADNRPMSYLPLCSTGRKPTTSHSSCCTFFSGSTQRMR